MIFKLKEILAFKKENKKQIIGEGLLVLLFFTIAFMLSGAPPSLKDIETNQKKFKHPPLEKNFTENKSSDSLFGSYHLEVHNEPIKKKEYTFLKRRNIFTPEGSYSEIEIPENAYILVAVKLGKPKQAILKLFTGKLIVVKEKDLLIDGGKVLKITKNSVIIERLGKKRELYIFQYDIKQWEPKSW